MLRVRVEAPCRPTEDPAKVRRAVLNLFPDLVFGPADDRVVGTTSSLDTLRERIRAQRIRDTARGQFLAGRFRDRTRVALSKQAAFRGVVNFAVGSPLGEIEVEIESEDLDAVIDYVAESTVHRELRPSGRSEGT
ncbi:MAG TPA: RNA-binding domain-containing protein [Thermoplasmata archaeon]|nr:RNA-binding domain-containing protein [Thermoplasmata archaeon]